MFIVLFVTDSNKENEVRVHKVYRTAEAAIEEAKKFTEPPPGVHDEELNQEAHEWQCCYVTQSIYADASRVDFHCRKTYEGWCSCRHFVESYSRSI